jgi:predicted dehydrogenase
MIIEPFIIGSGRSANAFQKSLALLGIQEPRWDIKKPVQIKRGEKFPNVSEGYHNPILLAAHPHALHAEAVLSAERSGFRAVVVEKPACVNSEQLNSLREVKLPVAVCHVYRMMWGIQTLKQMLDSGEFGELVCIEGKYWSSSSAQRIVNTQASPKSSLKPSWKNDPALSGSSDTLIDIGVHWIDAACFLMGSPPQSGTLWKSFAGAEAPHRDTHVQISMDFLKSRRAWGSFSKIAHGTNNLFEITLIGTAQSASWSFAAPDELTIGQGSSRTALARKDSRLGSQQPAFHGVGWIEGYIEVLRQLFLDLEKPGSGNYPALPEHLNLLEFVFGKIATR